MPGRTVTLTASERDWLRVRSYLAGHRHDLAVSAADGYSGGARVAGTPLLAAPGWQPASPVPLRGIGLELTAEAPDPPGPPAGIIAPLLPERADGTRYPRYSEALRELAPPRVFQDRATYRLTEANLVSGTPRLVFTGGWYFDGIDVGEAAAHEYAAARLDGRTAGALRGYVGDPCDLRRRRANLAIAVLTLRLDRKAGRASFLLHRRDPAMVAHAGGLCHVIPVGVFQPSGGAAQGQRHDFSLWRSMIREFAEELGGHPEAYDGPVDYDSWPFASQMTGALGRGQVRVWCLGLGADPLTYATDLLMAAVVDSDVFDAWFSVSPRLNAEGSVLAARDFTAAAVGHAVTREPMQAAGAAVLRLAWQHRQMLCR